MGATDGTPTTQNRSLTGARTVSGLQVRENGGRRSGGRYAATDDLLPQVGLRQLGFRQRRTRKSGAVRRRRVRGLALTHISPPTRGCGACPSRTKLIRLPATNQEPCRGERAPRPRFLPEPRWKSRHRCPAHGITLGLGQAVSATPANGRPDLWRRAIEVAFCTQPLR